MNHLGLFLAVNSIFLLTTSSFASSAADSCQAQAPKQMNKKATKISPESARLALVNMVDRLKDNKLLHGEKNGLKSNKVKETGKGVISIGRWYCDLNNNSFSVDFPDLPFFLEYYGVFEIDSKGQWQARIVGFSQS
jgi:hypothetical protein